MTDAGEHLTDCYWFLSFLCLITASWHPYTLSQDLAKCNPWQIPESWGPRFLYHGNSLLQRVSSPLPSFRLPCWPHLPAFYLLAHHSPARLAVSDSLWVSEPLQVQFPLHGMLCPAPPPYLVNICVSFTAQVICYFPQEVLPDASPTPTHSPGWVAPCLWLGNIL